jgi:hypothetical protein
VKAAAQSDQSFDYVKQFISDLERYDPPNIDYFLHQLYGDHEQTGDKKKEKMLELGRELIAEVILKAEKKNNGNFVAEDREGKKQNWYRSLRHDLLSDRTLEGEKGDDSILPKKLENSLTNLKIITFNYDVSLEYYLYDTLSQVLDEAGAQAVLDKLDILHVYGQVRRDDLPLAIAGYGNLKNNNQIYNYAKEVAPRIRVIGEDKSRDEEIKEKAKKMLRDAETLAFFGFGFDENNLEMLGLNNMSFSSAPDPDPYSKNPMGWIQGSLWHTHGAVDRLQLNNKRSTPTILYTNYDPDKVGRGKVTNTINRLFKLDEFPKTILRKSTGSVAKALADDFDLL